jgi:hypothetical protein
MSFIPQLLLAVLESTVPEDLRYGAGPPLRSA